MARKISVEIVGDARSLEKAFQKSSRSAKRFQGDMSKTAGKTRSSFGGLTRGVVGLAGAFVGTAGLATAVHAAFGEMADAQKVSAQTNAVLKSTGEAANVSAQHVDDLSTSLLALSGTDDEAIKSGENMLLTFRDIRNESGKGNKIFDQATRTMLDMSVALGQDTVRSAMQLGKALNDPVKGVTALRRVGVQFTKSQQDQIKALTESGHKLEAQKLILQELQTEFGGSAKAAGQTLPGKLNILRNTLLNLAGAIAATLTPAITKLVDKMIAWLSKSRNQKQVLDTVKAAAAAVQSVLRVLISVFTALNAITGSTKNTFKLLLGLFVAFKALKLVSYIASMTKAMQGFAVASAEANAAGAAGGGGKVGKAGWLARLAGRTALPIAGAYLGAKGLQKLIGQAPLLISPRGATSGVHGPIELHVDGHKLATVTARHDEAQLARRRRQRAHQRRSVR